MLVLGFTVVTLLTCDWCWKIGLEWRWLTFGLVIFPGWSPSDAGLVFVQVKESDQSFLLPLQFGHLSASLHGAHTPLHCRRSQGDTLFIKSQVAASPQGSTHCYSFTANIRKSLCKSSIQCTVNLWRCLNLSIFPCDLSRFIIIVEIISNIWNSAVHVLWLCTGRRHDKGIQKEAETSSGLPLSTCLWDYRLRHTGV